MLLRLAAGIEPMWESIPISLVSGHRRVRADSIPSTRALHAFQPT